MGDRDYHAALSKDKVLTIISRNLKSDNFKLISYELKAASEDMMGFLGVHFKIHANIKLQPNGESKIVQYFVKKMPGDIASHHDYAIRTRAYFKEISFYKRVVKDINSILTPGRKLTKWCPEFFFSRGEEIIVVEDLSLQGYSLYPDRELMDLEHIQATLKAFAALHAGSLILDEKLKAGNPSSDIVQFHSEIMFETEATADPTHPGNAYYEAGNKSQLAIVDLLPGYTTEQKEKIKERLPSTLRKLFEVMKPSRKYRNVWNHGDLWANNVMFKKDESGKLSAIMVDFQLARFAPPSLDVIFFLLCVQNRSFVNKHKSDILDHYYTLLSIELEAEGLDVEKVLPREEFDESCDMSYEAALLTQVFHFQFILSPPRINEKYLATAEQFDRSFLVDRTEMVTETFLTDEFCRQRVTDNMNEIIEFYHLAD